jgi:hypothetical protein
MMGVDMAIFVVVTQLRWYDAVEASSSHYITDDYRTHSILCHLSQTILTIRLVARVAAGTVPSLVPTRTTRLLGSPCYCCTARDSHLVSSPRRFARVMASSLHLRGTHRRRRTRKSRLSGSAMLVCAAWMKSSPLSLRRRMSWTCRCLLRCVPPLPLWTKCSSVADHTRQMQCCLKAAEWLKSGGMIGTTLETSQTCNR